ncbi:MAG: hypothetical protein P8P52_10315 [Opitutae bacterium]|nr:hypothetical protein [Opitutae bacterium]
MKIASTPKGKAVKIVAPLLSTMPHDIPVKVIFMQRDAREVIDSQRTMLERDGKQGAAVDDRAVAQVYAAQLEAVSRRIVEAYPKWSYWQWTLLTQLINPLACQIL